MQEQLYPWPSKATQEVSLSRTFGKWGHSENPGLGNPDLRNPGLPGTSENLLDALHDEKCWGMQNSVITPETWQWTGKKLDCLALQRGTDNDGWVFEKQSGVIYIGEICKSLAFEEKSQFLFLITIWWTPSNRSYEPTAWSHYSLETTCLKVFIPSSFSYLSGHFKLGESGIMWELGRPE